MNEPLFKYLNSQFLKGGENKFSKDFTGERFHSMDKGKACSHRLGLALRHQSNQGDTCHTAGLLCCAGSSAVANIVTQIF